MSQSATSFEPSLSSAMAAGTAATREAYGSGAVGVRQSLEAMALKIREGRLDPAVIGWARQALHAAGVDGRDHPSRAAQAEALLEALRKQTVYALDPAGAEVISSAAATLCLRPGLCIGGEDCDGLSVALASALLSVAIPTVIVKQSSGVLRPQHVLVAIQAENGDWLYADPSTRLPFGKAPPFIEEVWIDPLAEIGDDVGDAPAEIVTIGAPAVVRDVAYVDGEWFERHGDAVLRYDGASWVGLGTNIWGDNTVSDALDLANFASFEVRALQAAAAACGGWPNDPNGWIAWQSDLQKLLTDTHEAIITANEVITRCPAWLFNYRPAPTPYELLRDVIDQVTDLDRRLRANGSCAAPTYADAPQPTTPDSQLQAFQSADALTKKLDAAAAAATSKSTIGLVSIAIGAVGVVAILVVADRWLPRRA